MLTQFSQLLCSIHLEILRVHIFTSSKRISSHLRNNMFGHLDIPQIKNLKKEKKNYTKQV